MKYLLNNNNNNNNNNNTNNKNNSSSYYKATPIRICKEKWLLLFLIVDSLIHQTHFRSDFKVENLS